MIYRYDSGLVVSGVPDAGAALGLTPNQQVSIGLACNGVFATVANPLSDCTSPSGTAGPGYVEAASRFRKVDTGRFRARRMTITIPIA